MGWYQYFSFDYPQYRYCNAFDCVIKKNTASGNDCSTVDDNAGNLGVTVSSYGTISVDTANSNWPSIKYFQL